MHCISHIGVFSTSLTHKAACRRSVCLQTVWDVCVQWASAVVSSCLSLQVVEELGRVEQAHSRRQVPGQAPEGPYPVVVWWSPLTAELGRLGRCGRNRCFFTVNRSYHSHPQTKAFLFYGELWHKHSFYSLIQINLVYWGCTNIKIRIYLSIQI